MVSPTAQLEDTYSVDDAESNVQGGVIHLASQFDATGLADVMMAFHDKYPEWTVELEVLSQEALNLRLAAGDAPDLIDGSYDNFNVRCRNGYLVDLYTYMDADPDIDPSELIQLELLERNGALYQAPTGFSMDVVIALEETYAQYEPWDFAAFTQAMAAANSPQDVVGNMTSSGFVLRFLRGYVSKYVDYVNGIAQFDTEEFRLLLETAKAIGMDVEDANLDGWNAATSPAEQFQRNPYALMVQYVSCIDSSIPLSSYKQLCADYAGLPVMYRGFPSENGGNGTILTFGSLSMCSQAAEPEGAWTFLRFVMTDLDTQAAGDGFPIYRPALEQQIVEAKLTDDQAEDLRALIDGAADTTGYEGEITSLVQEESKLYFSGQQDLDTTVSSIESRVGIYLAEQH